MVLSSNHERLPLLSRPPRTIAPSRRVHYIDNLRTSLTIFLIFHHAAAEVIWSKRRDYATIYPIALLIHVDKYPLWGTFYFVSGYSASLSLSISPSLAWRSSDLRFFASRTIKVGLPMLLYAVVGQRIVSLVITPRWDRLDSLSGPTAYVLILLAMDYIHLFMRWVGKKLPDTNVERFASSLVLPKNHQSFRSRVKYSAAFLVLFTSICFLDVIDLRPFYDYIPSNDMPAFDAPVSYIIAYAVGVNYDTLKEHIAIDIPKPNRSLLVSFLISTLWLAFLANGWDILKRFIELGGDYPFFFPAGKLVTLTYTSWTTFVLFSVPISVVSFFSRAEWTTREWGFVARRTYPQIFIHMVPVLYAVEYTGAGKFADNLALRILLVGTFGVVASWLSMLGGVLLWTIISPLFPQVKIQTKILETIQRQFQVESRDPESWGTSIRIVVVDGGAPVGAGVMLDEGHDLGDNIGEDGKIKRSADDF